LIDQGLEDPVSETILPYERLDVFVTGEFCIGEMLLGIDRPTHGDAHQPPTQPAPCKFLELVVRPVPPSATSYRHRIVPHGILGRFGKLLGTPGGV
jgi:hypothetical protein